MQYYHIHIKSNVEIFCSTAACSFVVTPFEKSFNKLINEITDTDAVATLNDRFAQINFNSHCDVACNDFYCTIFDVINTLIYLKFEILQPESFNG